LLAGLVAGSIALGGCNGGSGKSGTASAGSNAGTAGGTTGGSTGGSTSSGGSLGSTGGSTTGGSTSSGFTTGGSSSGSSTGGTTTGGSTSGGSTSGGSTSGGSTSGGSTSGGSSSSGGSTGGPVVPMPLPRGAVGGPFAQGADVSKYEGTVDWAKANAAGLSFSIARVSDGIHTHDATFAPNWSGMKAQGMVRGVYQFFRASQDPIQQADYVVQQVVSIGPGDLPPFNDFETLDGVSVSQNVTNLKAWCDEIKAQLGITPAIYSSRRVWAMINNATGFNSEDLWVANWGVSSPAMPPEWKDWTFWQYTDSATVNGITGSPGVDGDEFHGTVDDLRAYAGLPAPAGFFRGLAPDSTGQGYWTCVYDGGVFAYGDATFRGTAASGQQLPEPVLGMVRTHTGFGYWLFGADGNVYPLGDAVQAGNLASQQLAAPIVGMAATPTGQGYFLLGQDGSVSAFGDAQSQGQPAQLTNAAVGIAATPTGKGYWIVSADGNVYPFGDAVPAGSIVSNGWRLTVPAVGIAGTTTGRGYWIVEADGGVQNFGDAGLFTYQGNQSLNAPIVSITPTLSGLGYWLLSTDGTVFPLGDAVYGGARPR
jgi:GH25 family lysozyme M1 (1,4-beta-N-acetylmuramidase)